MSEKRIKKNKLRRQRQLKRNLLLSVVTLIIVLTTSMFLGTSFVKATSGKDTTFKYYTSIEVTSGDTLWNIANANLSSHYENEEEYIRELKEINNLSDDNIHVGQYLIIPYYSSEFHS